MQKLNVMATIDYIGRIPTLGINGPLMQPTKLPMNIVTDLVKCGFTVYEHDPLNLSHKEKLTIQNLDADFFAPVIPKADTNIIPPAPVNIEIHKPVDPIQAPVVETAAVTIVESEEPVEETEADVQAISTQEQKNEVDPYAGMTRDERRRAKREAYNKMNQNQSK